MIQFEFERVLAGWWAATVGRSLDDLEYTIVVDGERHRGGFYRLENLVALYECTTEEIPSEEHPISTGYELREAESEVELVVAGERVPSSYEDLEKTLEAFLGDAFSALDRKSEPHEFEAALDHMNEIDTLFDFENTYKQLVSADEQ